MNKAIAILLCAATFAIILMFAIAYAEQAAPAENLVSVNPATVSSGPLGSLSGANAAC